jgi:hypothetical protein
VQLKNFAIIETKRIAEEQISSTIFSHSSLSSAHLKCRLSLRFNIFLEMAESVMSQLGEPANQLSSTKNLDNSDSDTDSEVHSFHLFIKGHSQEITI